MFGKIKDYRVHNNYGCYANGAVKAERNAEYKRAAVLWDSALTSARSAATRLWAEHRKAFCENAAERGWGVEVERAAV